MGIKAVFSTTDMQKRFDAFLDVVNQKQIERLQYLGEMCVSHARNIPAPQGFMDQTGNLRSSIGYAVYVNGVAIHTAYEQTKEGSEGVKTGSALADKVGKSIDGIGLVLTAGMHYAVYVESKGRDVITSAELLAKKELPRMLEELRANILKAVE